MSRKDKNPEDETPEKVSDEPLAGERLAEARRAKKIPLVDIAKELHLDEHKVRALEQNDFETIGAPVFAKGHLRKYAQLVDVSQDDVMADYYQLERATGILPVLSVRKQPRHGIPSSVWIAAIAAIAIAIAAYTWFKSDQSPMEPPAEDNLAPSPQPAGGEGLSNEELIDERLIDAATTEEDAGGSAEGVLTPADIMPSDDGVFDVRTTGGLNLRVTYSGDCWTEITDARGRRLFFGLGKAGRTVELSGEAPFNALFGNAGNVRLDANGAPVLIADADMRGLTAKLTITVP